MKSLIEVENFGGTDADNDDILLQAFEDHDAYLDVMALRRHMIIGKKGSGKTAIFKKIITTRASDFFSYGHTFQTTRGITTSFRHASGFLISTSTPQLEILDSSLCC